jgi:hypothetical protein
MKSRRILVRAEKRVRIRDKNNAFFASSLLLRLPAQGSNLHIAIAEIQPLAPFEL